MTSPPLDSYVFFHIPEEGRTENAFRKWVDFNLLPGWLATKEGNTHYRYGNIGDWNQEGGIHGIFHGREFGHCKLYKLDKEGHPGLRDKRGIIIRDHYSASDAAKVHFISDCFETYLQEQQIHYTRENRERPYDGKNTRCLQ